MNLPMDKHTFEKGRLDVLLEVKLFQTYGLWTKAERASWAKKAVAERLSLKRSMPYLPQVSTYYAGRVAGLRGALTAHYPAPCPKIFRLTVFLPLVESCLPVCKLSDCTHKAAWECYLGGDPDRMILLCDCCKERLVRAEVAYRDAPRDKYEIHLLPLPVPQFAQMGEELLEVFRKPAHSSPEDCPWLLMLEELADTPIQIGWRDTEGMEPVFLSVGEIVGGLMRLPVVTAPLCWLLLGWLSPVLAVLVSFFIALLFAPKWQQREDTHEHSPLLF